MTELVTRREKVAFPWLTGEFALYGLIACLALALRLGGLQARIMDLPEAERAWQAWQLVSGNAPAGRYSPLLLSGQSLLFALFGASDVAARLLPALAGSAMVLLPYYLSSHLGRFGSLSAALAMAVSPTLVYVARYGDGAALLLACVLGSMALWLAYRRDRRPAYLQAIAVMSACALLADPRVIGVLIVLGLAWAVERFAFGRAFIETDAERPIPWKGPGLTLGVTLILGATAFAFNPGGLGAWADFPSAWGAHFAPVVNGQPWYYPLAALLMYEPFVLVFGLIGAVDLLIRRDKATIFLWMALGLTIVALLAGGRDAGDVALMHVFLALLAGRAIDNLVDSWQLEGNLRREGFFVLILLAIVAYVGLEASFYARSLYLGLPEATQFLWFWLLAVALIVVLLGLCVAWLGTEVTWRAGGAAVALVTLSIAFSAATGLNFRHANDPRELHILSAPHEGVRDVLEVMADLSYHGRGSPKAISVTVEAGLGPVWLWYLRDWEDVAFVEELTPQVRTPLVLASEGQGDPALGDQYMGQDFVTRTWWQSSQLASNEQLSWWLYRKSISKPLPTQKVILWMKADEQIASSE